jgi:hypothetical protein
MHPGTVKSVTTPEINNVVMWFCQSKNKESPVVSPLCSRFRARATAIHIRPGQHLFSFLQEERCHTIRFIQVGLYAPFPGSGMAPSIRWLYGTGFYNFLRGHGLKTGNRSVDFHRDQISFQKGVHRAFRFRRFHDYIRRPGRKGWKKGKDFEDFLGEEVL